MPEKRRLLSVDTPGTGTAAAVYDLGAMSADSFTKRAGVLTGEAPAALRSALKSYFDRHD
ncbi:hypothetical protein [Nocardia sp. NPDC006630]|uniref:hypothetical protein n=1 Tax=Nocardia sp. NPDC006630 TaxID=3157181 RepID=UPI0033B9924C